MADIPASVLRDLPSDPAEVLAVSARLAAYAFSTKSAQCDAEVSQLRSLLLQRQTELRGAERRADELEAELAHARAEARRALGELDRAGAEKATLQDTVRALSKDVARLDHFRRAREGRGGRPRERGESGPPASLRLRGAPPHTQPAG